MMAKKIWLKSILIFALLAAFSLQASGLNPTLERQSALKQYFFSSPEVIDPDRAVGQTLAALSPEFDGEIELVWTQDRFSRSAQLLRKGFLARGIPAYRIRLTHYPQSYGAGEGMLIVIQQYRPRLAECNDKSRNYRFKKVNDAGCALKNNRSRMLVNSY